MLLSSLYYLDVYGCHAFFKARMNAQMSKVCNGISVVNAPLQCLEKKLLKSDRYCSINIERANMECQG